MPSRSRPARAVARAMPPPSSRAVERAARVLGAATLAAALLVALGPATAGTAPAPVATPSPAADAPPSLRGAAPARLGLTAGVPREALERLLAASGLDAEITAAVGEIGESFRRAAAAGGVDEADWARVVRAAEHSFSVGTLRAPIVAKLGETLEPGDVEPLLAHYRSALGRRVLAAQATRDLDDVERFGRFVESLASDPERDARLGFARALSEEMRLVESMATMQLEMEAAMLLGLAEALPPSARPEIAARLADLEGRQPYYEAALEDLLVAFLAFVYEEFTPAELETLLAEARRPASRRMAEAVLAGLREGYAAASLAFGERLGGAAVTAATTDEI